MCGKLWGDGKRRDRVRTGGGGGKKGLSSKIGLNDKFQQLFKDTDFTENITIGFIPLVGFSFIIWLLIAIVVCWVLAI